MIKFSSKKFIFPNCCSRLVTFVHSSLSTFLLYGDWYDADCGAGCVGYDMGTIGATGCVDMVAVQGMVAVVI